MNLRLRNKLLYILICLNLLVMFSPSSSFALQRINQPQTFLRRSSSPGHITVIILDMSGSMEQNDPYGVRCTAAEAYIDLSDLDGQVGIITLTDGGVPANKPPH